MKTILLSFYLILSCSLNLIAQSNHTQWINAMTGKWQVENKPQFEEWNKVDLSVWTGVAYRVNGDQKSISETLKIYLVDDQYIYEATVPTQNQGRGIPFTLNLTEEDCLSFENPTHDFPTKIQYCPVSDNKMQVKVVGPDGKGFGYNLIRASE